MQLKLGFERLGCKVGGLEGLGREKSVFGGGQRMCSVGLECLRV